jgi:hypothetical protein
MVYLARSPRIGEYKLIDVPYPPYGVVAFPTDGTSVLPIAPRKAVADGSFARVAMVMGANRDEGRTFRQGNMGGRRPTTTNGSTRHSERRPTRPLRNIRGPRTRTNIPARISRERSPRTVVGLSASAAAPL